MAAPLLVNLSSLLDDAKCFELIRQHRWPEGVRCPHCDNATAIARDGHDDTQWHRQRYRCSACGSRFDDLSGTVLAGHHQPLRIWVLCLYFMGLNLSNRQIAQELDLAVSDVQEMTEQLRSGITAKLPPVVLDGVVEADETYIGGRRKQSVAYDNKTAVVGIAEKRGKVKVTTMKRATAGEVLPFLNENIEPLSVLHTDESHLYSRASDYFKHRSVHHRIGDYSKNGVSTNNLEGFWSQLKRSINGTYHVVSPKYLPFYVDEFVFRYNHRYEAVCPVLLQRAAKLS